MGKLFVAALLLFVAGCAGGENAVPGGGKIDALLAKAPVYTGQVTPGSAVDRIRKRGELLIGGSQDAPLLSQLDPISGELTGFDAYLGKLLAHYVIGKPSTELLSATSETREPLLA